MPLCRISFGLTLRLMVTGWSYHFYTVKPAFVFNKYSTFAFMSHIFRKEKKMNSNYFPAKSWYPPCMCASEHWGIARVCRHRCYNTWYIIILPPGLFSCCWAAWRCLAQLSLPSPLGCFSWFQTGSSSHYKSADGEHRRSKVRYLQPLD